MKKLKKVWMLALLAAGFAMVIGCSNGSSDDDTKEPTPNPEKPSDPAAPEPITVFDPATYTGDAGKVVDGPDGAKYLEITPDGYNTSFTITEVDITGKTTVKCKVYGKVANDDAQFVPKLASVIGEGDDAEWVELATPTLKPIAATPTEITDKIAENAKSYKCKIIQPFTQKTGGEDGKDWSALKDITVYIGKITAE